MKTNNVDVKGFKYRVDFPHGQLMVAGLPQAPLMTCAALRQAACKVKNLHSMDEKKMRVRQLHDEILRYGEFSEPELEPSILIDLWGIWVRDKVANPDADIFVSCVEALTYAESGASITGHGWDQWLLNTHHLTTVVDRIFQSKYADERCDMIGALIPIVNLDGLAILINAIDRFNERDDYASLFGKINVALDVLKKTDADAGKWSELKRRMNDFSDSAHLHSEIERIINEGRQLSGIRPTSENNEGNAAKSHTRKNGLKDNISDQAAFKQRRNEIDKSHYQFRLENYHIAVERTLASAKSAPIEQAAAALARLRRNLTPNDPYFGINGARTLDQYVGEHLPSARVRYAELKIS